MAYTHLKLLETHEFSSGVKTCRYEVYCQYDGVHDNLAAIKVFALKDGIFHYEGDVELPEKREKKGFQQCVGDISSPVNQIYQAVEYCREHYANSHQ